MRILITGAKGQLGRELCALLPQNTTPLGGIPELYKDAEVLAFDRQSLDICDEHAVASCVRDYQPELIINCAAYNDVDACEGAPEYAMQVNAQGPRFLAEASAQFDTTLVHLSSDYVFPGNVFTPRIESDPVLPLNVYGKTKRKSEIDVLAVNHRSFVIRTSWLYGQGKANFVNKIMRQAFEYGRITVVDDQFGSPTSTLDLAYGLLHIACTKDYGIWHCANRGVCSRFEFASAIVKKAQIDCDVRPQKTEHVSNFACRPAFSALDSSRLQSVLGKELRHWRDALADYLENI